MYDGNVSFLMAVVFLLLTLAISLYSHRKTTSLREYAVGDKKFSTATLVATVLATAYSGASVVPIVQYIHHEGIYWVVVMLCGTFSYLLIRLLVLRMGAFMQHLSMAETIGSVYGVYPRLIAALVCIGSSIVYVAIQINIMAMSLGMYIDPYYLKGITIFTAIILIFYSTFGGIRAVTFTDVLQFITFAVIIPYLVVFTLQNINRPLAELLLVLQQQEKFQFRTLFRGNTKFLDMVALIIVSLLSGIEPPIMQRMYMASGPFQAQKVLVYSFIFGFIVASFIVVLGLLSFVRAPLLPIDQIWSHLIGSMPPVLQGCTVISLLAMAMSTADSNLNSCAVIVSNDIAQIVSDKYNLHFKHPLRLAKFTTLVVGLLAMLLSFYHANLLDLLLLALDGYIPVITAPFILALFGFRSSSRTALIGMGTGVCAILAWKQWVQSSTGIDGSFVCMLANGFAMLAAHYLLPQPPGTGWTEPDDEYKQIQQESSRRSARRKEAIKAFFTKDNLLKLKPKAPIWIGIYIIITNLLILCTTDVEVIVWPLLQLSVGVAWIGYIAFFKDTLFCKQYIPLWLSGIVWLSSLIFCFPIHMIWSWWYIKNPILLETLDLAHLILILVTLPLGLGIIVATPLLVIYLIGFYRTFLCWPSSDIPLYLLGFRILVFTLLIYIRRKMMMDQGQLAYFKQQQKLGQDEALKQAAYQSSLYPSSYPNALAEDGTILEKVVNDVTQSIAFLDDHPLYKEDFQSIIHKFSQWAGFLKRQAKSQDHILLSPTEISLDALLGKVEDALEKELGYAPRLLISYQANSLPSSIVCDVQQIIQLLVAAVLRVLSSEKGKIAAMPFVRIDLHTTHLHYAVGAAIQNDLPAHSVFPALAVVISTAHTAIAALPKVKDGYQDSIEDKRDIWSSQKMPLEGIDLRKKRIERIIRAHYGYLEITGLNAKLLVIPLNVNDIRSEMVSRLPMECGTAEGEISPKEQAESLQVLMEFHEEMCRTTYADPDVIAEMLLLLRRCYGFKRHMSGQLFYVRAVGIAQWVANWVFHSPKLIYAALLYDLVRYTRLPLSYIKANYDMGLFSFVEKVLSVDKHDTIASSLLHIPNRFKTAVDQAQLSVLYIKLAERLYDLQHADGYGNQEEVQAIIKETLVVDIELAKKYLEPEIALALEGAAKAALTFCRGK